MKIYTDSNISFEGKEYVSVKGVCEVPDNFPLDHIESHGLSTEAPAKPAKGAK